MPNNARPPEDLIPPALRTRHVGTQILVLAEAPSTNEIVLRRPGHGLLAVADSQTAGRGRHGRTWHSAPGMGVWMSIGLDNPPEGILFAAALAVRDGLRPWLAADIKWPNDILWNGRKLAGILVEQRESRTALGIGLNVNHEEHDFPEPLRGQCTSIRLAHGSRVERALVLAALAEALDRQLGRLLDGAFASVHEEWAETCNLVGKRIRQGTVEGEVRCIDPRGALHLHTFEGDHIVPFGDITVARID